MEFLRRVFYRRNAGSESRITARRVPAARSIDRAARDFPRALFRLWLQNPVPPRVICDAIFKNAPKGDSAKGSEAPIRRISHRNSTPNVIASRISIVSYAGKKINLRRLHRSRSSVNFFSLVAAFLVNERSASVSLRTRFPSLSLAYFHSQCERNVKVVRVNEQHLWMIAEARPGAPRCTFSLPLPPATSPALFVARLSLYLEEAMDRLTGLVDAGRAEHEEAQKQRRQRRNTAVPG